MVRIKKMIKSVFILMHLPFGTISAHDMGPSEKITFAPPPLSIPYFLPCSQELSEERTDFIVKLYKQLTEKLAEITLEKKLSFLESIFKCKMKRTSFDDSKESLGHDIGDEQFKFAKAAILIMLAEHPVSYSDLLKGLKENFSAENFIYTIKKSLEAKLERKRLSSLTKSSSMTQVMGGHRPKKGSIERKRKVK